MRRITVRRVPRTPAAASTTTWWFRHQSSATE